MKATLAATCCLLACSVALAAPPKGRPGLWTVTSVMDAATLPPIPPEALAQMKARGITIPTAGQPMTHQICMTADQPPLDRPPAINREGVQCTPHVVSQTGTSATTEVICKGRMEGTGRSQISWRGDTHYEGSYSFKGTMEGHPANTSTHYSGDFVKADCGAVRPFVPPR
jgi:hypothetical protein